MISVFRDENFCLFLVLSMLSTCPTRLVPVYYLSRGWFFKNVDWIDRFS